MGFFDRLGGTGGYEKTPQAMDSEFPHMTIREANEHRENLKRAAEIAANKAIDAQDTNLFNEQRKNEAMAREQTKNNQRARLAQLQQVPMSQRDSNWKQEFQQLQDSL